MQSPDATKRREPATKVPKNLHGGGSSPARQHREGVDAHHLVREGVADAPPAAERSEAQSHSDEKRAEEHACGVQGMRAAGARMGTEQGEP